jgi:hypothetical protein
MLAVSQLAAGRGKAASMPAAGRLHCILHARDLRMLAFVFGCAVGPLNFGSLIVVYYRIAQIFRLTWLTKSL